MEGEIWNFRASKRSRTDDCMNGDNGTVCSSIDFSNEAKTSLDESLETKDVSCIILISNRF